MADLDRLKASNMARIVGASINGVPAVIEAAQQVLDGLYNHFGKWLEQRDTDDLCKAEADVMFELEMLDKWGYSKCDHEFRAELNTFRLLLPLIQSERVRTRAQQVLDRWLKPKVG